MLSIFRPGEGPQGSPVISVSDVLDSYQRHCAAESVHGPAARADREYTFRLFREACGFLDAADLKPYMLVDFIAGHSDWKSPATRRAKASAIKAVFGWAFRQERISRNPFAGVQYAESERRPEMPDDALGQFERLANKQYETALTFLRLTACRTGELCRAIWADIDWVRGVWTIPAHKGRKHSRRAKEVVLVADAIALLKSIEPAIPNANAPVFRNTRGGPWTPGVLGTQLRRLKTRHGITVKATLHGVRHRTLSAMMGNGAPLKMVAEQAGHSTTAVTERYYYHRTDDQIEAIRAAAELGVRKK